LSSAFWAPWLSQSASASAIAGRALYDGRIDPARALALAGAEAA